MGLSASLQGALVEFQSQVVTAQRPTVKRRVYQAHALLLQPSFRLSPRALACPSSLPVLFASSRFPFLIVLCPYTQTLTSLFLYSAMSRSSIEPPSGGSEKVRGKGSRGCPHQLGLVKDNGNDQRKSTSMTQPSPSQLLVSLLSDGKPPTDTFSLHSGRLFEKAYVMGSNDSCTHRSPDERCRWHWQRRNPQEETNPSFHQQDRSLTKARGKASHQQRPASHDLAEGCCS